MSRLHIQLFGSFQVTVDDQPWDDFRSDKVRALVAYLALEGATPRRRSQLMALLWSSFKPTFARANLRMTLANLRQLVAPFGLLQTTRQAVRWYAPQVEWTCDALMLEQAVQEGERTGAELWPMMERLALGEFLPGFEQIDSLPWQLWLQDKRIQYVRYVDDARRYRRLPQALFTAPDWSAIPQVSHFHGRLQERNTLRQWLVDEQCRLVAIFGLGGQGKTALAAALVRDLAAPAASVDKLATTLPPNPLRFATVIWRSLSSAPPLSEILLSWLQILANQQFTNLPALVEDQFALLMKYLQIQPTLLVLDNLENILQSGDHAGRYQPGYESYGELLRRMAASDHHSCLVLVSREQPQEFHRLQTQEATIRALHLRGLESNDAQQLLVSRGLRAPTALLTALIQRYAGHPLALQVAAETIQEFFGGKLVDFLAQAPLILADLRAVLDQHFARLSPLEQTILIWLAIEAEPIRRQSLLAKLIVPPSFGVYLEAERSLLRRFQIDTYGERLGLQSLLRAYLTDYLANQIYGELRPASDEQNPTVRRNSAELSRYPLPDENESSERSPWSTRAWVMNSYLNRYQLDQGYPNAHPNGSHGSPLLQTVAQQLVVHYGLPHVLAHLHECLNSLHQALAPLPGYAIPNLIQILRHLGVDDDTLDHMSSDVVVGSLAHRHFVDNY